VRPYVADDLHNLGLTVGGITTVDGSGRSRPSHSSTDSGRWYDQRG
jgi:hypothetical protein